MSRWEWKITGYGIATEKVRVAVLAIALFTLVFGVFPVAVHAQQKASGELQKVWECGGEYYGHPQDEIIASFQKKGVGADYKRTLIAVQSPYSHFQKPWKDVDPTTSDGIRALISANAYEDKRRNKFVDSTSGDATHTVLMYYMASAKGGECTPPADFHAWISGLAYDNLARKPDIEGLPFAELDYQQVDIHQCSSTTAGEEKIGALAVTRWIVANNKSDAFDQAARIALSGSLQLADLDSWMPLHLSDYSRLGFSNRDEARVFTAYTTLWVDSTADSDYIRRLKSRLLVVYYESLASGGSCNIPTESLHVIESLHASSH